MFLQKKNNFTSYRISAQKDAKQRAGIDSFMNIVKCRLPYGVLQLLLNYISSISKDIMPRIVMGGCLSWPLAALQKEAIFLLCPSSTNLHPYHGSSHVS